MRLSDLLTADQLHTDSFLERAELVRVDPVTYESRVIEFDPRAVLRGDGQANLVLQRLDKVIVGSQARAPKAVTVSGEVRRPGRYVLASGERLSSLLRRVGGFTERAFPKGIVVIRESVRRAQQEETDRYTALQRQQVVAESASVTAGSSGLEREVASTEQAALRAQLASLDESARRVQAGRVVIEVESIEKLAGGHEDLVLEAEDQIAVPERPQTVSVLGAVRNPASFAFYDKLSASDYIRMAGGPTQFGRVGDAYVLRSSGSAKLSLRHLGIGDTIVVPEYIKPKTRTLPLVVSLASIFASLATTAAALVILSR